MSLTYEAETSCINLQKWFLKLCALKLTEKNLSIKIINLYITKYM